MGRAAVAAAVGALLALAGVAPASAQEPESLRAGAGQADITPPVGTPMFAYTGRSRLANPEHLPGLVDHVVGYPDPSLYAKTFVPSEGIHTRVRARALVIERGGRKHALVQADLGGLPHALTQEVARRIRHTGITEDRLLLTATHTHASTGPIWPADSLGYALLGGDLFDPRIFDLTAAGIAEAIVAADADLQPARAGVGAAELHGASRNRAFEPFQRNEDVPDDEEGARAASIDPTVSVLRVDSADGRPIGVWSSFAVHPTSFGADNPLFSGDNAGVAERVVEAGLARAGGAGALNIWSNGAEGDVSPDGSPDRDDEGDPLTWVPNAFASTHVAGERVGKGILAAWEAAEEQMSAELAVDARHAVLAFDGTPADGRPVGPMAALGIGGVFGPDGLCSPIDDLAGPGQGRKMPLIAGAGLVPLTAPVAVWRLGGMAVVGLPSEVTRQMGQRIRAAVRQAGEFERVAIAGLANGYVSYTSTPEEYDACHYEGSFTLYGRHQGARLRDFASRLARSLAGDGKAGSTPVPVPPAFGIGISGRSPVRTTPDAGEVVQEPEPRIGRYGRAVFRWRGGDPAIDAPRGGAFVTLERLDGGDWVPRATDDVYRDTTVRGRDDVWTEAWQFSACERAGRYRFRVRGRANRGSGTEHYELASDEFEVARLEDLSTAPPEVQGGRVRVRAFYPDPGEDALLALPRRVRSGWVDLRVTPPGGGPRRVRARPDDERLEFEAGVEPGSSVEVIGVRDRCGNTGGPSA